MECFLSLGVEQGRSYSGKRSGTANGRGFVPKDKAFMAMKGAWSTNFADLSTNEGF